MLRVLTHEVLEETLQQEIDDDRFAQLMRDKLFELRDGAYYCHDLLSEAQTKDLYEQKHTEWRAFHQRAYDCWRTRSDALGERRATYHQLLC